MKKVSENIFVIEYGGNSKDIDMDDLSGIKIKESDLKVDIFPAKTNVKGIPLENSQDKIVIIPIP